MSTFLRSSSTVISERGFSAETFGVFRDGMRFNSLSGKLDPYELESVEVLKGPSSVLYVQVPPGGLINQVTKRPPAESQREIGFQLGAYDRRQFQGDFDYLRLRARDIRHAVGSYLDVGISCSSHYIPST